MSKGRKGKSGYHQHQPCVIANCNLKGRTAGGIPDFCGDCYTALSRDNKRKISSANSPRARRRIMRTIAKRLNG